MTLWVLFSVSMIFLCAVLWAPLWLLTPSRIPASLVIPIFYLITCNLALWTYAFITSAGRYIIHSESRYAKHEYDRDGLVASVRRYAAISCIGYVIAAYYGVDVVWAGENCSMLPVRSLSTQTPKMALACLMWCCWVHLNGRMISVLLKPKVSPGKYFGGVSWLMTLFHIIVMPCITGFAFIGAGFDDSKQTTRILWVMLGTLALVYLIAFLIQLAVISRGAIEGEERGSA